MNKVDESINKLQEEIMGELMSSENASCDAQIKGFMCTRPKGHSGYHIAAAPGYFIAIWFHMISD